MSDDFFWLQYIGEVRMFGGEDAPEGWMVCAGQILKISEYGQLHNLIGNIYGGDGLTTFALPDLRGRTVVGKGQGGGLSSRPIGDTGGSESIALQENEIAQHYHSVYAVTKAGTSESPCGNMWATSSIAQYSTCLKAVPTDQMSSEALSRTGGGKAHSNMMPSLTINYMIAVSGEDPIHNGGTEGTIGEIRIFAFDYVPVDGGWVACNGSTISAIAYEALFNLIGTTFGGDGKRKFGLPDLRGRVPIQWYPPLVPNLGATGGQESVLLTTKQMPEHTHQAVGSLQVATASAGKYPTGNVWATIGLNSTTGQLYSTPYIPVGSATPVLMDQRALSNTGGTAHSNMQPFTAMNYCIARQGLYPSDIIWGAEAYIGEIHIFTTGVVIPLGWIACLGQTLKKEEYNDLYKVIKNTYGGDGETFKLPDLRARVPIGQGTGPGLSPRTLGSSVGENSVTLNLDSLAEHSHTVMCQETPDNADAIINPLNNIWAGCSIKSYIASNFSSDTEMASEAIGNAGNSYPEAHNNIQPYLGLQFIIAYAGKDPYPQ